ncbi:hypothetical protein TNCV_374341 [Trichonephila clavipes]|nr:hypothetical protein TNCV_374341 [Trichonephila clavipes]
MKLLPTKLLSSSFPLGLLFEQPQLGCFAFRSPRKRLQSSNQGSRRSGILEELGGICDEGTVFDEHQHDSFVLLPLLLRYSSTRFFFLFLDEENNERKAIHRDLEENGSHHVATLGEYSRLISLLKGLVSRIVLKNMTKKLEYTGGLGLLPGRERKPVGTFEEVATAVFERASCSIYSSTSG